MSLERPERIMTWLLGSAHRPRSTPSTESGTSYLGEGGGEVRVRVRVRVR